jgi:hypothetical protein
MKTLEQYGLHHLVDQIIKIEIEAIIREHRIIVDNYTTEIHQWKGNVLLKNRDLLLELPIKFQKKVSGDFNCSK